MSPPVTSLGFLLANIPITYTGYPKRELTELRFLPQGVEEYVRVENWPNHLASDINTIELPSGRKLSYTLNRQSAWQDPENVVEYYNYSGKDPLNLNNQGFTGPPVYINDAVIVGITENWNTLYVSHDEGRFWTRTNSNFRIGDDRFNLLPSPEGTALWAIKSEFYGRGSLFESTDEGDSWAVVADGSFPEYTNRVVHDPADQLTSYALTSHGLYVSENRAVSWEETSWTAPVHSLVFVERDESLSRAIVIGTNSGVKVSTDEMDSWTDLSDGLLSQPHSVTYGHGQLLATSDSGYFTCTSLDCFGTAQSLAPEQERGVVEVVEFYHSNLNHYFITATEEEATAIDQGAAGAGWIRTGEKFLAWGLGGGGSDASDVCRFYGSINPGPNSHFYSVSPQECRFLMDLQELYPDDKPRWNFEGYTFSILPPASDAQQPCPETAIPVYRAYNNAFRRGEDSNHRYMTDPDLMIEMVDQGWIDEGIAFCSPAN
ncbi:WD40/YVTN/BNR-like repeat-containing protein [Pseudomonadota bacterium]